MEQSGPLGGGEGSLEGVALRDTTEGVADFEAEYERVAVVVAERDSVLGVVPLADGDVPNDDVAVAVAPSDTVDVGTARQEGSDAEIIVPLLQEVPAATACSGVAAPLEHWTKKDEHGDRGRRALNCANRNAASAPVHAQ